jgi:hypothetical protein
MTVLKQVYNLSHSELISSTGIIQIDSRQNFFSLPIYKGQDKMKQSTLKTLYEYCLSIAEKNKITKKMKPQVSMTNFNKVICIVSFI